MIPLPIFLFGYALLAIGLVWLLRPSDEENPNDWGQEEEASDESSDDGLWP